MCGIVGVLSFMSDGFLIKDVEIFEQLHKVITVRGEDGAGIFYAGDKDTGGKKKSVYTSWVKIGGTPYDLYQSDAFKEAANKLCLCRFLIGHVRYATHGKINSDNAHPFQVDHISLVHNGMIDTIQDKNDFKQFNVDSHALCDALSKDTPKKVLEALRGPAAVVWYDSLKQTINIFRNLERPLYYVELLKRIFLASEAGALSWILDRNHIEVGHKGVQNFEAYQHYEFTHEGELTKTKIDEPPVVSYDLIDNLSWYRKIWPSRELLSPEPSASQKPFLTKPQEKKAKKLISVKSHMGVKINDVALFEVVNTTISERADRDTKDTVVLIDGILMGLATKPPHPQLLSDIMVASKIKAKTHEDMQRLCKEEFFRGKVVSLMVNPHDISEVRAYLTNIEPITPGELRKYANEGRLIPDYEKIIMEHPMLLAPESPVIH